MNISIIGLGWFGSPLATSLAQEGHVITGSTTSDEKVLTLKKPNIHPFKLTFPEVPKRIDSDILILNVPPFAEELEWFKSWDINPETWIIFISSTSVLSMKETPLREQEEWVKTHSKWTILRFGGLFGNGRHPGKSLSGKKKLAGRLWPVNMLHLDDAIGFTKKVIESKLQSKTFTVISDEHPTREEFYTRFCIEQNLPLPEFDQADVSTKSPLANDEASKFYSFMKI